MSEKQMIGVHALGKVSEFRQNVNPTETKSRGKLREVLKERKALPSALSQEKRAGREEVGNGHGRRGAQGKREGGAWGLVVRTRTDSDCKMPPPKGQPLNPAGGLTSGPQSPRPTKRCQ